MSLQESEKRNSFYHHLSDYQFHSDFKYKKIMVLGKHKSICNFFTMLNIRCYHQTIRAYKGLECLFLSSSSYSLVLFICTSFLFVELSLKSTGSIPLYFNYWRAFSHLDFDQKSDIS